MDCAFTDRFIRFLEYVKGGNDIPKIFKQFSDSSRGEENLFTMALNYTAGTIIFNQAKEIGQPGILYAQLDGKEIMAKMHEYVGAFAQELNFSSSEEDMAKKFVPSVALMMGVSREESVAYCASTNVMWAVWRTVRTEWKEIMAVVGDPVEDGLPDAEEYTLFAGCEINMPIRKQLDGLKITTVDTVKNNFDDIVNVVQLAKEVYKQWGTA